MNVLRAMFGLPHQVRLLRVIGSSLLPVFGSAARLKTVELIASNAVTPKGDIIDRSTCLLLFDEEI